MTQNENEIPGAVKLAFQSNTIVLRLDQIVALKVLRPGAKESRKYSQILTSVRTIGLVESPVVTPDPSNADRYFLLDGLMRLEALKDLGHDEVECLISTDDEAYTYNKQINRLTAVQEHQMILRAIERGVPQIRIAEALGLDVTTIRRRFQMLDGICAEVVELLKDTSCPLSVFEILRQMAPIRQIEAAELMVGQNNFTTIFAKALLVATADNQLVNSRKRKGARHTSVSSEQMSRMERELAALQTQVKSVEDSYGLDNLALTVAKGYIRTLLENYRILRWFSLNRKDYLFELQSIAEIDIIGDVKPAAE